MSSDFKTILYEKKGSVAWITLNRPEVLNAQNDLLRAEVVSALELARDDDTVHAIAITGVRRQGFQRRRRYK